VNRLNRRDFLKASAAATMAATPGMAFSQAAGVYAPFPDYKALVCVFLFGGNDSFNMVVPRSGAEYAAYAASRQNLAVAQEQLLAINPLTTDGASYGLHPSMSGIRGLFETGRAAFINNIGPLIEPTSLDAFAQKSVALPPQLFSHNDQQDQWFSLKGNVQTNTGWAGRIADLIRDGVAGQQMPTNASLFGNTLFQSANESVAYVMGADGPVRFAPVIEPGEINEFLVEHHLAFDRVVGANYPSIYQRAYAEIQRRAAASADLVSGAIDDVPPLNTVFPQSELGQQLHTVARLIAANEANGQLQMQRQIFFVAAGGFDTHDAQVADQPGLLAGVSEAMTAFYNATVEVGVAGSVTSFTQSDFARTLTSNGDGSDHAWGGIQLVVGDAVAGREMYGRYPRLEIGGPEDVGGGRFIPTTSADQYAATLARWFGIVEGDLDIVAPNIGNFTQRDLGFLLPG
jgi:uncharacterized protein (DUF1501 family)